MNRANRLLRTVILIDVTDQSEERTLFLLEPVVGFNETSLNPEVMRVKPVELDTRQQTFQVCRKLVQTNRDAQRQDSLPGRIRNEVDEFLEAIILLRTRLRIRDVVLEKQRHPARILVELVRTGPRFGISNQVFDRAASEFEDQDVAIIVDASGTNVDVKRPLCNRDVVIENPERSRQRDYEKHLIRLQRFSQIVAEIAKLELAAVLLVLGQQHRFPFETTNPRDQSLRRGGGIGRCDWRRLGKDFGNLLFAETIQNLHFEIAHCCWRKAGDSSLKSGIDRERITLIQRRTF